MDTEKRNSRGQTVDEFLAAYDPTRYERPAVTVDVVLITYENQVLLIRRGDHPSIGKWALPGGFVDIDEELLAAAKRELEEETGLNNVELTPLGIFGEPTRDPRMRIFTSAFTARARQRELKYRAGDDAADAGLFAIRLSCTGRIELPEKRTRGHEIALPCTACGTSLTRWGEAFLLELDCERPDGSTVGAVARLAVDDDGNEALLGDEEGREGIAGDHALIIFSAMRKLRLV